MSKKSLSHTSDEATQQTNTTGEMTAILEFSPNDGNLFKFLNRVATGDESGLPFYMGLLDSAGNALPTDTKVLLRATLPHKPQPVPVSEIEDNIAAWNGLSTKEQRNEENVDQVKIELEGETVNIRDIDKIDVAIESSAAIDWSQSGTELYVERAGVRELPFQG